MKVIFQNKEYNLPTGYNSLSWATYLNIKDSLMQMELVARVLGIPYDDFLKCDDIEGLTNVNGVLSFLNVQPVLSEKAYLITLEGKVIMTPKKLDKVTFAQYNDISHILAKEEMGIEEKIQNVVAIASMKENLGYYDSEHLDEMIEIIKSCSVQSVLETYRFFFANTKGLNFGTGKTLNRWAILKKRCWRALKKWSGLGY